MDKQTKNTLLKAQINEITEFFIYQKLAGKIKDPHNQAVLLKIAGEEKAHHDYFERLTGEKVGPRRLKIWYYYLVSRIFGLTFGVKLMERGEGDAQDTYSGILKLYPELATIIREEEEHEKALLEMLDEERLKYVGSIVLGLNDALVELTGALAGLTLALKNSRLIALAGLVTGIAASFSMAASEYLSKRHEGEAKPLKAALYTGIAYIFTVFFLIFPYLILNGVYLCLSLTLFNAILVILFFTFYTAVAQDRPFGKRFLEMALISLTVAALSFGIGYFIGEIMGIGGI